MSRPTRTAEEARADLETPQALLRRSGFAAALPLFAADLDDAADLDGARRLVTSHGRRLWAEAVRGSPATADDRPLYWARLTLTARLRSWRPGFPLSEADRADLLSRLEHASRGHDALVFPPDDGLLRVIVTGFDPFGLDDDIRRSNPSGVAAITLDGAALTVHGRRAVVRTALFPVRWRDFTEGIVERALLPHYTADSGAADAVITVSQGRPGWFDLEVYNGARRGGGADNDGRTAEGPIPLPPQVPVPHPRPQWTTTSLPCARIAAADTGHHPVRGNTEVTEIPAGGGQPVVRPGGPTPGSTAVAGGGGDYLSNEIAYRNTLLRDATGRPVAAGHVHTPVLAFAPDNEEGVTDPVFEAGRAAIVAQTRSIVAAALEYGAARGE
ncbi:pyroglutamyl peptidase [Marinitenerispora sediminis]|nr:pyroglutamyl peptidase [Marinitenerispora sediminis]RCV50998.1 pyroglutamyl peptidase [Marinitenerispora sediminis]RCV53843.1 pyroglutamyl peptidase [Marinitenerispora sediminis]